MTNKKWGHEKGKPVRFIHGHHKRKPLPVISAKDLAWLTGLYEGEGTFVCSTHRRSPKYCDPWDQPYVKITIAMTDEDVIARVASLFNTTYCKKRPKEKHYKMQFAVSVAGPKAIQLVKMMYDELSIRRKQQIDTALAKFDKLNSNRPVWPRAFASDSE